MKRINIVLLVLFFLIACSREELSPNSVVDDNFVKKNYTELDNWIRDNITLPYGIEVDYRWRGVFTQRETYSYPANPENVKKVLLAIKYLWLDTYTLQTVGNKNFMKEKNPIKIYMYGGKNIDSRGVELISNPESIGAEMYIYDVNDFDDKDAHKVYKLMRSVHHQFAKRLAEFIPYDRDEFLKISQKRYIFSTQSIAPVAIRLGLTGRLFEINGYPNKRGFFTIHSLLTPEDDFAEIVSVFLTNSPVKIDQAVKTAATPDQDGDPDVQKMYDQEARYAHGEITRKLNFVKDYFDNKVKIKIERLQLISIQRINDFLNRK